MSGPNIDEYDPIIPGPNDFLAVSQEDFLANFGQLYNAFARNHVALDHAVLTPGNHTNIELLQQVKGPETSVGENSLYSKKLTQINQTTTQLFFRYQGGQAAGKEVQMTNYQLYSPGTQQLGLISLFTYLPGGLILYFGIVNFSKTNANTLYLAPFICTTVMAFNFTAKDNPGNEPTIVFHSERPGIVTTIQAQPAFGRTLFPAFPDVEYYFVVLGNTT